MIEYFIVILAIMAVAVIVTVVVMCCCGCLCRRRKPEDDNDGITRVIIYPENDDGRAAYEPHSEEQDRLHLLYQDVPNQRYHYYYHRQVEGEPVTAAVADSAAPRDAAPYVGTVVANQNNAAAREPVSYGEAVYYSRPESSVSPPTKPHAKLGK